MRQRDLLINWVPFAVVIGREKTRSRQEHLQKALDELQKDDLKRFKSTLNNMTPPDGYDKISRGRMEEADSLRMCELLIGYYTTDGAVEMTIKGLKEINQRELARQLEEATT